VGVGGLISSCQLNEVDIAVAVAAVCCGCCGCDILSPPEHGAPEPRRLDMPQTPPLL
jgi:hypothetical protein